MRSPRPRFFAACLALLSPLLGLACDESTAPFCMSSVPLVYVAPQQVTLAPGDTSTVRASVVADRWIDCAGRSHELHDRFAWHSSNVAVVSVTAIDSTHALLTGIGTGQTTVVATIVDDPDVKGAMAVVGR